MRHFGTQNYPMHQNYPHQSYGSDDAKHMALVGGSIVGLAGIAMVVPLSIYAGSKIGDGKGHPIIGYFVGQAIMMGINFAVKGMTQNTNAIGVE